MKIRDRLPLLAVLCCFSALLLLPEVSAQAARDAMLLCAQTLIPSLFPFFVLSSLLIACGASELLSALLSPLMRPLFGLSGAGAAALVYGIISWRNGGDFGMYFALFGFAAIFFFSGAHVLPTAKNNKKAVARAWEEAQANLAHVLPDDFPLPARYAHPVVLTRMIRILREGRAQSADEALEVLKSDLKALNADVQVSQEEYDEVVAIKSMFLLSDYQ